MGKTLRVLLVVAGLLCIGMLQSAKADSIPVSGTATSDAFTGVSIYSVTNNPYGVPTPATCPGAPCQAIFGTTATNFEVATVTFFSNGGFTISNITANPGAGGLAILAAFNEACAGSLGLTPGTTSLGVSVGSNACPGSSPGWTAGGNPQNGTAALAYLGNGVFTATDNSFEVVFKLTPTPEPSSLLMLGSGLLGMVGLVRRKKIL